MLNAERREFFVGANSAGAFGLAFGEGRRVEDDQIKRALFVGGEPIESVRLHALVAALRDGRIGLVERKIPFGAGESVRADVEVGDGRGAAARRVKREPAGKAEGVQNAAAFGERFDRSTILALVQEEAGFLT